MPIEYINQLIYECQLIEKSLGNNETKDTAVRYSCGHCKKTFAHKNGLATHLDTHKGISIGLIL